MTQDEKIDAIHDAVIQIKADLTTRSALCEATHRTVDSRIEGLHKRIVGNGQPGLEQKHQDLASRFDKLETKVIVWASVAIFTGQIILPKLVKAMGWG